MRKLIVLLLVVGLVATLLPGFAYAKNQEKQQVKLQAQEKNKPELKAEIRVAFKGVVVKISGKILDVALVEPFAKNVAKRIGVGPVLNVNADGAQVFKAGVGKVEFKDIIIDAWVMVNGIYDTTKKVFTAKIIRILQRPPGRIIAVGIVKSIINTPTEKSFTLEMKPKKGDTTTVLRTFKVTPKTIFQKPGVGQVGFGDLTVGAHAAVKGYAVKVGNVDVYYATFVAFKPAP